MKRFIALLIVLCLAFAIFTGCNVSRDEALNETQTEDTALTEDAATETETGTEEAVDIVLQTIDYEALYATHQPDEVIGTAGGDDVTWDEYFYWIYYYGTYIENYMQQMATYYGTEIKWDDMADEQGTYAALPVDNANEMAAQLHGAEKFYADNKIELTAEDEEELQTAYEEEIVSSCGEGATEEDFEALLASEYYPKALYEKINRINKLSQRGFEDRYGENGEKVSDEDALNYLEENNYLAAGHILLMTIDSSTREALTEAEIAQKKATAEELAAELKAITDPEELKTRFAELKEEYCEDTGKETYPDGYLFAEGTMVTEFEDAVKALSDYEVSDPVLSSYGYHIIMRLPLDPDATVTGSTHNARYLFAANEYNEGLQASMDECGFVPAEGFSVNLSDYIKEA
jgi:hypothetical protein